MDNVRPQLMLAITSIIVFAYSNCAGQFLARSPYSDSLGAPYVYRNREIIQVTPKNERELLYDTIGFRKNVLRLNLSENQALEIFEKYPWSSMGAGGNSAMWKEKWLGAKTSYDNLIGFLLSSSNTNQALVGVHLSTLCESQSNLPLLRKQLDSNRSIATRMWTVISLTALQDSSVDLIFNTVCELEDIGDAHLIKSLLKLDKQKLSSVAAKNILSGSWKTKIISCQVLGITSNNYKSCQVLKDCVRSWPDQYKGYAISAISYMNGDSLSTLLTPLLKPDTIYRLDKVSREALANSPTLEDQQLLINHLQFPNMITFDGLDLLLNSSQRNLVENWVDYVTSHKMSKDFYPTYQPTHLRFGGPDHLKSIIKDRKIENNPNRNVKYLFSRVLKEEEMR